LIVFEWILVLNIQVEMKVLVTGANGLLGSHVVRELLKREYPVRVLVRPHSNLKALDGLEVDFFYGNLTDPEDVLKAVIGCTHVIHSAARAVHSPSLLEAYRKVNIDSTDYILEACIKEGVQRLVYVSTANCIGNGTKANPGTEDRPFVPWFKGSGYAYSKLLAQQMVLAGVESGTIDAVVVNPTFIIGSFPGASGTSKLFSFVLFKKVAFYPFGGKNYVDAEAAAAGTVNAMEMGRKGECYLLAGENHTYMEVLKLLANVAGHQVILLPMPVVLLKLAGIFGSFIEKIFKIPVLLTYVNARMLCHENYYSPAKAMRELGMPLIPTVVAVKKALPSFIELQEIKDG
jgi:dihydroflavonol-4-reductase